MADRPLFIATPHGSLVAMGSGGNPVLDVNRFTVTWNGVVEQFNILSDAQMYYDNVKALMIATVAPTAFIQDFSTKPIIFSITPNPFSVLNDGTYIQINGTGFSKALETNHLTIDDVGGLYYNGYAMTLVYVSPILMTGTWYTDGDGVLPDGFGDVTITDGATALSNVLRGIVSNKAITL